MGPGAGGVQYRGRSYGKHVRIPEGCPGADARGSPRWHRTLADSDDRPLYRIADMEPPAHYDGMYVLVFSSRIPFSAGVNYAVNLAINESGPPGNNR